MPTFVAVDLGATSGRVARVEITPHGIALDIVHRFATATIVEANGGLTWDVRTIIAQVRRGLVEATRHGPITSIGVDAWGVDYGLLDDTGRIIEPVHAYRSARTDGVMDRLVDTVGRERIYRITGTQFLPFNTLYQLVASRGEEQYRSAARLLMLPDLITHELCGSTTNDLTSASTTQLLDVRARTWAESLADDAGLRRDLLPELHEPGTELGPVRGIDASVDGTPVVAVAAHDTASAVAATPLHDGDAYISCGTWSLVGQERSTPVTTTAALHANLTNELGVAGTIRILKNVTGLWLLEECRRSWAADGHDLAMVDLVAAAAERDGLGIIDPDDAALTRCDDIPQRVASLCAAEARPDAADPATITRTILDSLAATWSDTVDAIEAVTGTAAERIDLVGGGAAIDLLAHLCARACERPVLIGPVEATALGNAIVQAISAGVLDDVAHGRRLVRRTARIVDPSGRMRSAS